MLADFKFYSLKINGRDWLIDTPKVMGILNTTSDSFYDGGKYHTIDMALARCEKMLNEGADIIDIGGQSSRPGAELISEDEELEHTVPFIKALLKQFPGTLISVDTNRSEVARLSILEGASIINDISAGEDDACMLSVISEFKVPYIAMHKKGRPKNMQDNPGYEDVVAEVKNYLKSRLKKFSDYGIENTILDPGFGFGKTMEHNYSLLGSLETFHDLNRPVLIGISRKSMVYKLLNVSPLEALNGTTALHMIALLKGAHILRVHDVKEAKECIRIARALNGMN